MNVGEFLVEKLTNMRRWLHDEGLVDPRPLPSAIELTVLAQELNAKYAAVIRARDFNCLPDAPEDLKNAVRFVRERVHLHDKFWRYLELFSDTVSA